MANSNPVTPQELQEVENNIEISTQALADAAVNAKELGRLMEERTPKIIQKMPAIVPVITSPSGMIYVSKSINAMVSKTNAKRHSDIKSIMESPM